MKELSIEEKAKRYDEMSKEVKDFFDGKQKMYSDVEQTLNHLFPELKESDDEKIRKEMIFYFQQEMPQCSIQEHADKMKEFIAWLKRQEVERTKLELKAGNSYFCYKSRWERADSETFKKGLIYKCNKDGVLDNFVIKNPEQHFVEIKDERIAWLEKQDEQKPTDKVEPKFKVGDRIYEWDDEKKELMKIEPKPAMEIKTPEESLGIDSATYNNIVDECIYGEQKPNWSEEDEETLNRIRVIVRNDNSSRVEDILWLKSLRDRVQPQPKQEWSEEDEEMFERIDDSLKTLRFFYNTKEDKETWKAVGEEIAFIKTLKKRLKEEIEL